MTSATKSREAEVQPTRTTDKIAEAVSMTLQAQEEAERARHMAAEAVVLAKTEEQRAKEALEDLLSPYRERRQSLVDEQAERREEVESLKDALNHARNQLAQVNGQLADLDEELAEAGIPVVLLGVKRPRRRVHKAERNMKKTLKPSLVGAFEPIQVTGLRRHGNRTKRVTIEIESNGEVFKAKRLDIPDSPTFESRRMSDVTTAPGWLETKDVGYAVISALGKRGQFPAYEPVNDPSTILVNGKKI